MSETNEVTIIAIEGQAATSEEAIRLCAAALEARGIVGPGYAEDCLAREAEYPTGVISEVPVAIPHCRSEAILGNGLCYLRLSSPVDFRRMDDDAEAVGVRSIFNFAVGEGDHLTVLSRTMQLVANAEAMRRVEAADIADVPALLRANIVKEG